MARVLARILMLITMVNVAVHQASKRTTRLKEPNAIEVEYR